MISLSSNKFCGNSEATLLFFVCSVKLSSLTFDGDPGFPLGYYLLSFVFIDDLIETALLGCDGDEGRPLSPLLSLNIVLFGLSGDYGLVPCSDYIYILRFYGD